jgi:aquaporin Z
VTATDSLRAHWPEYLIEAWALGMFMVSAAVFSTVFEFPHSSLRLAIPDPWLRMVMIGIAMGLTAVALIYSPWGKRSGAHMNPSVTLAFLRLGKIQRWDALFYICAQFAGGTLGVVLASMLLGNAFSDPPVSYAATQPGSQGIAAAFVAEFAISAAMMATVLTVAGHARYARFTGWIAGLLVATYISVEAPVSGMSMNPARSFASAAPGMQWQHLWIYFTAPVLGMLAAAQWKQRRSPASALPCAKLIHAGNVRCIHCGFEPPVKSP